MNKLATEEMESSKERIRQEASGCQLQTMHTQRTVLHADDELVFPKLKRVVTEYSTDATGVAAKRWPSGNGASRGRAYGRW